MKIVAAAFFDKTVKKLHDNAKRDLDAAVKTIAQIMDGLLPDRFNPAPNG